MKSIVVGICAAAAFIPVAILGVFGWLEFFSEPGVGSIVSGRPILLAAFLVFAGGFAWEFHRLSRRENAAER